MTNRLSAVRSGARRVGDVAVHVEDGLAAISGILVELRHGIRTVVDGIQTIKETNTRLASMEKTLSEKLASLDITIQEVKNGKGSDMHGS